MLRKLFMFVSLLALVSGCKNKVKTTFENFPKTVSLTGSIFNLDRPLVAPQGIILRQDRLVLLDKWKEGNLHIFDTKLQHFLASGAISGQGAGEVLAPWTIISSQDNSVWVYDVGLARLTNFSLDSVLLNKNYKPAKLVTFPKELKLCYYPLMINDTTFVSPHYTEHGRLAFLNSNGKLIKYSGVFPAGKSEKISHQIHAQAYQSVMCTNPEYNRIALATRYADQIEIYDEAGTEINRVIGPEGFRPRYRALKVFDNLILELSQKGKFGYIYVQGTSKFIYALYSGMSRAEFPGKANFGQSLHVFDWQGKLVAEYKLDHLIYAFDIEEKTGTLFAIQQYPDVKLIKYQIPLTP